MSPEQKLIYGGLGESDLSAESTSKAYQLRDRTSDREKFFITASYHRRVTGNLEKAKQTCELWAQNYPREMVSHDYLAAIYPTFGRYDQGVEEAKKAIGLAPDFAIGYALLAMNYQFLDLLEEATNTLQQASGRKLEIPDFLVQRYDILLKSDKAEMQQESALGQGKSGAEDWISDHQAFVSAYSGRLQEARRCHMMRRNWLSMRPSGTGRLWMEPGWHCGKAFSGMRLRPAGTRWPHVSFPNDLGAPHSSFDGFFGTLYPVYVRGEAYLAAHQAAQAAAKFQKILDHRGIVVSDPVGALAHLQLGRAFALSGDKTKAKTAYQDFLALWKDADPDIPILKQAKAEYAKLQVSGE